jgi:hypothetical protein
MNANIDANWSRGYSLSDIAGMVASMTEGEPGVESERTSDRALG